MPERVLGLLRGEAVLFVFIQLQYSDMLVGVHVEGGREIRECVGEALRKRTARRLEQGFGESEGSQ